MPAQVTAERVARNQATFREANEQIERKAEELRASVDRVPFICECPDADCTSITRVSLVDYEMVRSRPEWFLVAPGHEVCVVNDVHVAEAVKRYDEFSVMQKINEAAEVAEELDPRQ
ncbi:MAG: hypothetical protein ACJ77E_02445 [Gaiellaceae bacterium]